MPAITVDTTTLPMLSPAALGDVERPVHRVTSAPSGHEGEGFPVRRAGSAGPAAQPVRTGNLVVFGAGDRLTVAAAARPDGPVGALEVLLLGGSPLREPVEQYGPFVMNTRAELAQAMDDYQSGRLGVVPPGALTPHVYSGAGGVG